MDEPGGARGDAEFLAAHDVEVRSWRWPDAGAYGEDWAHDYEKVLPVPPEWTEDAVAALAKLADGGRILEVAAGTGRVAVPLARRGLDVSATDASAKMLDQLAGKEGGDLVRTWVEVLPAVSGGDYAVVAILANSLWVLATAEAQQEFLRNAAARLAPGGVLVIEMSVVDTSRWANPRRVDRGAVGGRLTTVWNADTQRACHTFHFPAGVHPRQRDVYIRYLLPDQLLTMAEAEGLTPRHLWSDWHGTRYRPGDNLLVAVLQPVVDG